MMSVCVLNNPVGERNWENYESPFASQILEDLAKIGLNQPYSHDVEKEYIYNGELVKITIPGTPDCGPDSPNTIVISTFEDIPSN